MEELAELFGDPVVVHLTTATAAEKEQMDMEIKNELMHEQVEQVERVTR